ncbi:MAG: AAA family ATPase [Rhodocyclaceae bacterium]
MYYDYFGFTEPPFAIAPDPRYLFMSDRHREALAHLVYGLRTDGGFVLLTGEVGTGKTTLCRCLLEQIPEDCDVAFIFNPRLSTTDLLATICEELKISFADRRLSPKVFIDLLNFHLLETNARGRRTVLIIDEAQSLSRSLLEQLRLLTNLETYQRKLLQIILLGQPELRQRLAKPDLRQLSQRIVARFHLDPLSREEVAAYVAHRLAVAGVHQPLFPPATLDLLYRLSQGTPRLINVICDRALLGAFVEGRPTVAVATIRNAAREVLGDDAVAACRARWWPQALAGAAAVLVAGLVAVALVPDLRSFFGIPAVGAEVTAPTIAAPMVAPPPEAVDIAKPKPVSAEALDWPPNEDYWMHEALAVHKLFGLWKLDLPAMRLSGVCAAARSHGLRCMQGNIDLAKLRAINLPAVVELRSPTGANFVACLGSLNERGAELAVGRQSRRVAVETFAKQWSGSATIVWRGPPNAAGKLAPGTRDPVVSWAGKRLAQLNGGSPIDETDGSVERLRARVADFQRTQGLEADGVLGPATQVRLAQATDREVPNLAGKGGP